jgi:signal transduction histidine kinase
LKRKFRKPDTKSLRFKLWVYFLLFTVLIMGVLWMVQVFFLNSFYEDMKIRETTKTVADIEALYRSNDTATIRAQLTEIYEAGDMYMEIQTVSGTPVYIPNISFGEEALIPVSVYQEEIKDLKTALEESGERSFSRRVSDNSLSLTTLEYATYIELEGQEQRILYIFSPLYPVGSTIDILVSQLIYVTIISILMACIISLYLARRITQPLISITQSAARLGEGEYGIIFDGAHYSEIIRLADTLTYTSLELAKTDNMQKDVIANVSHDLRTPLTMITSYAEMIRDLSGENPEKRNAHLQVIMDEADRLNTLVTDFLDISHMQSGRKEISLTEFSMKEIIESLLQSYTGYVEQEGYKLVFISRGQGVIRADQERIKQVISNLVSNAFKYSGSDKHIEVKMFDEGDYVRCEVSDHGIGIPKKDLRHIWERYYKASTNYHRSDSTGLGLSIVKEILLLHGANFGVESALKKGSTFWFEIRKNPLVKGAAAAEDTEETDG